jgi:lambda family phage minor tail protein L
MSLSAVSQSLTPGAEIFLYRLDATAANAGIHYFVQAKQVNGQPLTFGGQAYTPIDISVEDFESNAGGVLPTPKMQIGNSDSFIQDMVNLYGDLAGCEIRRVRTFARFLDGFPEADPNSFVGPDVFRIERKSNESPVFIEWELSAAIDQEGKMLPGRQYLRDVCTRRYRRFDPTNPAAHPDGYVYPTVHPCPYSGAAAFTPAGAPTTAANDRCGRKDSDCRLRFGEDGVLPTGAFPGIARVQ